ncbi:2Fe-2S ferredoxin-type domain-containing protein [Morchella snyderi]|nr:2Fe-2S ferredoxin-type domain-containing protein [Morchella snyderi]
MPFPRIIARAAASALRAPPLLLRAPAPAPRAFTTAHIKWHGHVTPPKKGEELHVTFIDKEGKNHTYEVAAGDNLLDIAQENDLEMEGACGGSAACSTCHVIVEDDAMYEKLPEPEDDENDMLDLAFGLTETSRLGCQVHMNKAIDGIVVRLPSMTRNLQSSDFSKK